MSPPGAGRGVAGQNSEMQRAAGGQHLGQGRCRRGMYDDLDACVMVLMLQLPQRVDRMDIDQPRRLAVCETSPRSRNIVKHGRIGSSAESIRQEAGSTTRATSRDLRGNELF